MNNESLSATDRPQLFLKALTFNDGTQLMLNPSSIIVFTGANNVGKSQVLKDIERHFRNGYIGGTIVRDFEDEYLGSIEESEFLKENFSETAEGLYPLLNTGSQIDRRLLRAAWEGHRLDNGLHRLFVKRLSSEFRLTGANDLRRDYLNGSAIYTLYSHRDIEKQISQYFFEAFLIVVI